MHSPRKFLKFNLQICAFCPCLSQTLNLMQHVLILEVYDAGGGCARSQRSMVATPMVNPSVCPCVCLSASISLVPLDRSSRKFVCRSHVAVARSSSGGAALRYVLTVLWMTSRLAVMVRMALRGRPGLLLAVSYVRDRGGV